MKLLAMIFICMVYIGWSLNSQRDRHHVQLMYSEMAVSDDTNNDREVNINLLERESTTFWDEDYDEWAKYLIDEPFVKTIDWWERYDRWSMFSDVPIVVLN